MNSTDTKQRRKFGVVAFVFFGALFALGLWTEKLIPVFLFGFLCLLGLGLICMPGPMGPIYRAWLKLARLFGRMVTVMTLALTYYLVVTPSAMIKWMFGGRPIQVKPDKDALSYWVERDEPAQPRERFKKRY